MHVQRGQRHQHQEAGYKEAIPPLATPGRGCAPSGIPRAVTSITVVTLVPISLHSHYISISTIYIGPVYSCMISLITPPPPPLLHFFTHPFWFPVNQIYSEFSENYPFLTWLCQSIPNYWNEERATGPKPTPLWVPRGTPMSHQRERSTMWCNAPGHRLSWHKTVTTCHTNAMVYIQMKY